MKKSEKDFQRLLFFSITALGISSIITQILIMREFLSVFYGNELVFGVILANWLLLGGVGSYLGKYANRIKNKVEFLIYCQIIIALLPFVQLFLIRVLRNYVFIPGELIGIIQITFFSFILLLPYCIIAGFLLTLACVVFSTKDSAKQIGMVYFIDNIGDILGGLLFSFLLVFILNPFQSALLLMLINLIAAMFLSNFVKQRKLVYSIIGILIVFTSVFFVVDLNRVSTEMMFKGQELVYYKSSRYGNLVVTKQYNQLNFFENGQTLFTTQNTIANEEVVHYAMVQSSDPSNVLLISGGVAGTIDEILKYNIEKIDYVELDPQIIEIGKKYTNSLQSTKLNVITGDGRLFVKQTEQSYDVVIIDLPDPNTAQINRFYTIEFFTELKDVLNENGVVSLSVGAPANYYSKEARQLNSVVYQTLSKVFKNVIIIPGDRNFFITSDSALSHNIAQKIDEKGIDTEYVNEFYLVGILTKDRIDNVMGSVNEKVSLNTDFNPVSYYYHLLYWLTHFGVNLAVIFIVLLAAIALFVSRLKPIQLAIFTTGFAGAGLEVVLLIGFQVLYGYVYHMVGVIITAFMLGLAIGSFYMNRTLKRRNVKTMVLIEFLVFVYSVLLPLVLILLTKAKDQTLLLLITWILFPLMTIALAILVGMEFPLASKLSFKGVAKTAASLYNADLIGACVGALLASALLIPLLGIVKVCIIVGVLNLVTGIVVWRK